MMKNMKIKRQLFDGIILTAGAFVVQPTTDGRTMFAGVIPNELFEHESFRGKEFIDSEIWVCELQITYLKRFERPDDLRGARIDQVLRAKIDISTLKEIKSDE